MKNEHKYDLAFSFCQEDEALAIQLYDLLKTRVKCFIYIEQQKRLAGKDGEVEFNHVFGKESRFVAVLYREKWGKTPWTRKEETAIRNRAHDYGYGFVLFIPTDTSKVPDWLPKTQLWIGINQYGIESIAAILEQRVIEHGGEIKEETLPEKAERIERENQQKLRIRKLMDSEQGVKRMEDEMKSLYQQLLKKTSAINQNANTFTFQVNRLKIYDLEVRLSGYSLYFDYNLKWNNTLDDSKLKVRIYQGFFNKDGYNDDPFYEPKLQYSSYYKLNINLINEVVWTDNYREDSIDTSILVDKWLDELIDIVTKNEDY
jgi:hypothetical protein